MKYRAPDGSASGAREFLARRPAQDESRVPWLKTGPVPPPLRGEAVRRLGITALVTAASSLAFTLLHGISSGNKIISYSARYYGFAAHLLLPVVTLSLIAISLYLWRWTRKPDIDHKSILDFGSVYQILICVQISLQHHLHGWEGLWVYSGWSGPAFIMVTFAIIVPATPGRTLLVCSACALCDGLAFWATVRAGAPMPPAGVISMLLVPDLFAVFIAYLLSLIVHRIGQQIARAERMGSYRLVANLGKGGMGEVWRAEHSTLARPAAIKLIRPDVMGGDPGAIAAVAVRFEREAQATALLSSAHTIRVYDYGQAADGSFFYVMELLDGIDLEHFVKRFGPMPPARAVHVLRQACHSLGEAHARGFVHRDIKPSNIFLCRYGRDVDHVKVLDFGIVKPTVPGLLMSVAQTQQGTISGTPAYLAPEQARSSDAVDGRSDLYALGCVAFWLLTGRTVFDEENALAQIIAHQSTPPDRVSDHAPVPQALDDIVSCCLAKRPEERFPDADTLDAALAAIPLPSVWTQSRARAFWDEYLPAGSPDLRLAVPAKPEGDAGIEVDETLAR